MMLKVNEIFVSVSGERGWCKQGDWVTFIRLDGCNLKCSYCDTKETQNGNQHTEMTVEEVVDRVQTHDVIITGGEPLLQEDTALLIDALFDKFKRVSVETNGTIVPTRQMVDSAWFIIDYKLDAEDQMMDIKDYRNTAYLVKFVINSPEQYATAVKICKFDFNSNRPLLSFSPGPFVTPNLLFEWMKNDRLWDISLNLQLHKLGNLREKVSKLPK